MVPSKKKGKYAITVPKPYEFQKEVKKEKSIRQKKLDEMLEEKENEIREFNSYKF